MKCLVCNKVDGKFSWYLYPEDFKNRGVEKESHWLANCFCETCYTSLSVKTADTLVLDYVLGVPGSAEPKYYKWHPVAECLEISQQFSSNLGQALQYIWRSETMNLQASTKGQTTAEIIKDLEKARNFIGYEIERLEETK